MRRARRSTRSAPSTTALVLVIVLVTKFTHGAWIVVIAMPLVFALMTGHPPALRPVARELRPGPGGVMLPSRIHAIVLVSKLHTPTLRALAFARATRPHTLTALTVRTQRRRRPTALVRRVGRARHPGAADGPRLPVPRRHPTGAGLHRASSHRESPRDVVSVFIPEYVVGHWWEQLLHNQSALRLKARLLFQPGVMVTSVPWQLGSAEAPRPGARAREEPWLERAAAVAR